MMLPRFDAALVRFGTPSTVSTVTASPASLAWYQQSYRFLNKPHVCISCSYQLSRIPCTLQFLQIGQNHIPRLHPVKGYLDTISLDTQEGVPLLLDRAHPPTGSFHLNVQAVV